MSGETSNTVEVNQHNSESDYVINRSQSMAISITSIGDSSVIDSDSDIEDTRNVNQSSVSGVMLMNRTVDTTMPCQSNILCANTTVQPNIGSVTVQNSSRIAFGNKTIYQGPVTIKQFRYDKNKRKATETETHENDNPGYVKSSNDKLSQTHQDHPNIEINSDLLDKKRKCRLIWGASASVLVCSLLTLILIVQHPNPNPDNNGNASSSDGSLPDETPPLRIISRRDWLAQPPRWEFTPLELPSTRVIIAQTQSESCTIEANCTYVVKKIQEFHIDSRGWNDIGYNFLIGGDGIVYVGRGWDSQGSHTKGYNKKSICIAFIGTFNSNVPPKRSLYAAQKMIEEGLRLKKLSSDYGLYAHRHGLALYEVIQKWDHWISEIEASRTT